MREQELLSQLNNLKNIKPDSQWEKGNRELLFNQICGSQSGDREAGISWIKVLGNMAAHSKMIKQLSQPAFIVCAIVIIVFGGGIAGVKASQNAKPGDSLYIAKIISEKTQFAITFDEKDKAKLGLDFASNRAREISQVIAESDKNKEAQVEKLTKDFKNEIKQVKSRMNAIVKKDAVAGGSAAAGGSDETQGTEQGAGVFSANLGKDNQRMEISEPENKNQSPAATTTETAAVKTVPVSNGKTLENALDEAEKLFDEKNYDGTLNKLNEANDIINKVGEISEPKAGSVASTTGEVLGASEEAGN
ncbi:DUF5667 domain-containing protein [Candidatus Parcubacteria bacterium]|nr:hypothetical protein [Patescibacteria group bacterium]MCG2690858.1 DUF5667 domain-containing protein [Candidatus Parcubacteria bacterium]